MRGCGGIGRRVGFKIRFSCESEGSSPSTPISVDAIIQPLLTEILQRHMECSKHLFGYCEHHAYQSYLSLNNDDQAHFQRLFLRKNPFQRVDKLELSASCFKRLTETGLLRTIVLPKVQTTNLMTRNELSAICVTLKLPSTGRKSSLIERLLPHWEDKFNPPMVWVAYRHLFHKAVQWYTANPNGHISDLVIQELGYRHYFSKGHFNTQPMFKRRKQRVMFEIARRFSPYRMPNPPSLNWIKALFDKFNNFDYTNQNTRFDPLRRVFRSLHQWVALLTKADLSAALSFIELVPFEEQNPELVRKLALECQRQGKTEQGLGLIKSIVHLQNLEARLALTQTYNQMAHKIRKPRLTLPIIKLPNEREIELIQSGTQKNRPVFRVNEMELSVENAVCQHLALEGHIAIYTEGVLWQALMIILFWEAFKAPITGQLPSPVLRAPLDFKSPEFVQRRLKWIEPIMKSIANGQAISIFEQNQNHLDLTVKGLESHRITTEKLRSILVNIPCDALTKIMNILLFDCHQNSKGMPDLIIFPKSDKVFSCAFPNRFRSRFLLAELKTRNDKLSPAQSAWFHRLILADIPAELWQINHKRSSQ